MKDVKQLPLPSSLLDEGWIKMVYFLSLHMSEHQIVQYGAEGDDPEICADSILK